MLFCSIACISSACRFLLFQAFMGWCLATFLKIAILYVYKLLVLNHKLCFVQVVEPESSDVKIRAILLCLSRYVFSDIPGVNSLVWSVQFQSHLRHTG